MYGAKIIHIQSGDESEDGRAVAGEVGGRIFGELQLPGGLSGAVAGGGSLSGESADAGVAACANTRGESFEGRCKPFGP